MFFFSSTQAHLCFAADTISSGIWYKQITVQTVVWVFNRDTPLTDPFSSELKLLENGNLVLFNSSKIAIWSTKTTSKAINSSEVVLWDDGNLVLRNRIRSPDVFWQSFDYPTHTWLPGGKIRYDNRTKTAQLLTSWKNENDPGTGLYSFELDPTGDQTVILRNRTQRFVMDVTGQITQTSWAEGTQNWIQFWSQPRQQCDVYAFCGAFGICNQNLPSCTCLDGFKPRTPKEWSIRDYSGGCVRNTSLQCGKDDFSPLQNVKLPANQPLAVPSASSADECKSACLNNCSCSAYAYSRGCSVWNGDLLSLQKAPDGDGSGIDLYLRLAASDIPRTGAKHKGTPTPAIVGAAAGIVALLGLVFLFVWRWQTRQSVGTSKTVEGILMAFTYRDLQNATKNFSEKLGRGGQGEKQFRSEVSTIGIIQHINLVRLHGFCSEGDKRLLVYDYMPNGSLDHHMFNQQASKMLNWKVRYQIALGTARGLTYLHEKCRDCIIHCDIKPENILLDADFCPKVADFGLAKLIGREFSRVLTTMRGTRGYLAPEWIWGAAITAKADVYSYGMMLFEIISGRRNLELSDDEKVKFFPTWAARKISEDEEVLTLLDYRLEGTVDVEELTRACRVACWCIQDDESDRPSMGQVVQILEGVMEVNPPPIPRALQVLMENEESIHFF
ncbi:hypothetical protein IFM89_033898 [Coptis chinensis]|uniref:Receptor-like serine/threonine-protein kinase n=1 Tax=Coptis chinensis TaxID=261450 RepID=A0A835H241_9MAGN|nr:hypothetical protein IFM89_033898 [Coptis chinensis]